MFVYIQSILLIVLEILCSKIFFEVFGRKRDENNRFKTCGIFIVLMLITCTSAVFLNDYFIVKQILVITVNALFMYLYITISLKKAVILSILFQGLLLAVDYFALQINQSIFSNTEITEGSYKITEGLIFILTKALLFLCVLFIKKNIGKKSSDMLMDTEWLRFIFFPIFTICTIAGMISTSGSIQSQRQSDLFWVIAFGLAGMNIVVFYLINDILEREMQIRENKIFEIQVKGQTDMYRSISENFDKQKKKTHEYKNEILCIESLIRNKNYSELKEYVNTISGNLSRELDSINTNHAIVNAILNTKYQEALDKNMVFVFRINDLSDIKISDEDIVVILSNLLNNAIEACEQCTDKRIIKLKLVKEERNVVISVKNTYNHNIIYKYGDIQTSKKNDSDEHGVGIKNIISAIKKYGGSYIIKHSDEEFYFSIIIPQ